MTPEQEQKLIEAARVGKPTKSGQPCRHGVVERDIGVAHIVCAQCIIQAAFPDKRKDP